MKLPHLILVPFAVTSALVARSCPASNETAVANRNRTSANVFGRNLEYLMPRPWKTKTKRNPPPPQKKTAKEAEAARGGPDSDQETRRKDAVGGDYGAPKKWKIKPWLQPDEYAEDWFALDYEVCRNSIPMTEVEGCVVFRGLEWLLFSVVHTASLISPTDTDMIFKTSTEQRGPMTLVLRAILLWNEILKDAKHQMEATKILNLESQLKLIPCYLDYAYQVTAFLQAFEAQGSDFKEEDPFRCLVFDKMEILYLTYMQMTEQMYGSDPAIRRLFDERFPDEMPNYWHSKYEQPKPGELIADYVRRNDWPRLGEDSPLRQTQKAWRCIDDRKQFAINYPTKWSAWEKAGKPNRGPWFQQKKDEHKLAMKKVFEDTRMFGPPDTPG